NGPSQIHKPHAGNFRHEDLPAMHAFEASDHKPHALFQGDPKPRHASIGHGDPAVCTLCQEHGNHAAPAPHDVSVTTTAKPRTACSCIGIGLHEHLFRAELCCTVQVDWVYCLIGAERQNFAYALVDSGINYVLPAKNIGLNCLERVVLA